MTVDEALADVEARAVCPLHEPEHVLAAEVRRLRGETEIRRIEHLDACKVIDRLRNAMLAIKLAAFRVHKESADIANLACDASAEAKP
jgi:hypothetical protein